MNEPGRKLMKLNSHLGGWLALGVLIGAMATPVLAQQQKKRTPPIPAAGCAGCAVEAAGDRKTQYHRHLG
jgi:hypothetical protein